MRTLAVLCCFASALLGCAPAAAAPTPPTQVSQPTADVAATVQAAVRATVAAMPTPAPTATPAPASPTPRPPTPLPATATPTARPSSTATATLAASPTATATATPAVAGLGQIQALAGHQARERALASYVIAHPIQYNLAPRATAYDVVQEPALCRTVACRFVGDLAGITKVTNVRDSFGLDRDATIYRLQWTDAGNLFVVDYYTFEPAQRFRNGALLVAYGYVADAYYAGRSDNHCGDTDCSAPIYYAKVFGDAIETH